jgi:hypothetical protein
MGRKKQHIDLENDRYSFMTQNYYNTYISYGRHYIENHIRHKVKIYKVNVIKSKSHDLYGESKPSDKVYQPPVEIFVLPIVETKEQYFFGENPNGITRDDIGKITFNVFIEELKEKNLDIDRGDVIEYNLSGERNRFFEVEYANNVTDQTNQTIGGHKPYLRKIIGTPIKEDVSQFLKN